jgi:hypothetical protein
MTPQQKQLAIEGIQKYLQEQSDELAAAIALEIREGMWETSLYDAGVTAAVNPDMPDEDYDAAVNAMTDELPGLIKITAVFQFTVGSKTYTVPVDRDGGNVQ